MMEKDERLWVLVCRYCLGSKKVSVGRLGDGRLQYAECQKCKGKKVPDFRDVIERVARLAGYEEVVDDGE